LFKLAMRDQMQLRRFERKYFLSARQAARVREFVQAHLEPDEFSASQPDRAYPVHSLYLDSDGLTTYWATIHDEKKRFKLRVRYYDDQPDSPVFFEIKRRVGDYILKERGAVHRSAAPVLLAGHLPETKHLFLDKPSHLKALLRFGQLVHLLDARPRMQVAYDREAWVSPGGNAVRVTLDRHVRGEVCHEPRLSTAMQCPVSAFGDRWVLELKFTQRFPEWMGELVRHFNLIKSGAPKYCGSVDASSSEQPRGKPISASVTLREEILKYL
jgi:hypothetical protein